MGGKLSFGYEFIVSPIFFITLALQSGGGPLLPYGAIRPLRLTTTNIRKYETFSVDHSTRFRRRRTLGAGVRLARICILGTRAASQQNPAIPHRRGGSGSRFGRRGLEIPPSRYGLDPHRRAGRYGLHFEIRHSLRMAQPSGHPLRRRGLGRIRGDHQRPEGGICGQRLHTRRVQHYESLEGGCQYHLDTHTEGSLEPPYGGFRRDARAARGRDIRHIAAYDPRA